MCVHLCVCVCVCVCVCLKYKMMAKWTCANHNSLTAQTCSHALLHERYSASVVITVRHTLNWEKVLLQWGFTTREHPTVYTGEGAVLYCTLYCPLGKVHGQTGWPIKMAPRKLYVVRHCFTVYLTALPSLWEAMQASSHHHWVHGTSTVGSWYVFPCLHSKTGLLCGIGIEGAPLAMLGLEDSLQLDVD